MWFCCGSVTLARPASVRAQTTGSVSIAMSVKRMQHAFAHAAACASEREFRTHAFRTRAVERACARVRPRA
eukprot:5602327-Pleurochrysis_carterae.AAC.1